MMRSPIGCVLGAQTWWSNLRIKFVTDSHEFFGKLQQYLKKCVDPVPVGSAWIRTYPLQPNVKLNYYFFWKFQFTVQNIENYDTYDNDDLDKTI